MSAGTESYEDLITRLVVEYAQSVPSERPLGAGLSLRRDLAVESLSLVALALRLGEELGIDVVESGIELGKLDTVGDLVAMARALASRASGGALGAR